MISYECICQLNVFDIGLGISRNQDAGYDNEYQYDNARSNAIYHFTIGSEINIASNMTVTPKVAYSRSLQVFNKAQRSVGFGSIEDMTAVYKSKTIVYLKTGISLSYYIQSLQKGFFLEGELQGLFNVSANSEERKLVGRGDLESYNVSFRNELKTFVPSVRLGFGYVLRIHDKVSSFLLYGLEFRSSALYKNREKYRLLDSIVNIGFKFKL